jgi:hypothetical protein
MTYDVVYSWGDEGFYFNEILAVGEDGAGV